MDDFQVCGKNKAGNIRYAPKCRECYRKDYRIKYHQDDEFRKTRLEKNRLSYKTREPRRIKEYTATRYTTISGRAKEMLKGAKRRSYKFSDFDLSLDFIIDKLNSGVCEVTGIPFSYDKPEGATCNKFSPSLDRVDNSIGYVKSNVRVVIWQYNLMKGQISDYELLEICQAVVNKYKKE